MGGQAIRRSRKLDHLRLALDGPAGDAGWGDVRLVHQSLPEAALDQVDLRSALCSLELPVPVVINAMTGGVEAAEEINRALGHLGAELGVAVAVGSQRAALTEPRLRRTYAAVRDANPRGVVFANLGAGSTPAEARAAVAMVGANALQLHLNAPQELQMAEGDRDFRGRLQSIGEVVAGCGVPVIVKECGFGMSRETAVRLHGLGVRAVDVGGRGGTNFARIEQRRSGTERGADPALADWGIPTAASLLEVVGARLPGLEVVASGGVRWGTDAVKALALGAVAVGVAGPVWRALHAGGYAGALDYLRRLIRDMRIAALLVGATDLQGLRAAPRVLTGLLRDWAAQRPGGAG